MNPLILRIRKLWQPTLLDELEQQTRDALRPFQRRQAPDLRVFVSVDRLPPGVPAETWAAQEEHRLGAFAARWAEDNAVDWRGRRIEVLVLDTAQGLAWVKPAHLAPAAGVAPNGSTPNGSTPNGPGPDGSTPRLLAAPVAELVFVDGVHEPLQVRQELILGRDGAAGVGHIDDPKVSRRHLALRLNRRTLTVTDLGSRGGTRVNDDLLRPSDERPLAVGDVVTLGGTRLRVTRTP